MNARQRQNAIGRHRGYRAAGVIWVLAGLLPAAMSQAQTQPPVDFSKEIRPLLSDKCFACHGPDGDSLEADLRLDDEASVKGPRDEGPAVVPGKPAASLLWQRITEQDDDLKMPPADSGKKLTAEEIDRFKRWIEQGAPWAQHWAYVPPVDHPTPQLPGDKRRWAINWIDNFLLEEMTAAGLAPVEEADEATLFRRLSFDLRGLPPSADEVAEFLAEKRAGKWDEWIDRFLESPAYGERMAVYWLDLVRYADTVGYHGDQEHSISPYREWVIDALNDDLPFDEFTRAQIAGDLLPDRTLDTVIASGYNRLLQTSHEGGVQAKEYLAIYSADHVRNLASVWLGATMVCAQCHDHKYDPYTMKDFYSMAAFFADLDEGRHLGHGVDRTRTLREPEIVVLSRRQRSRLVELCRRLLQLSADENDSAASERKKLEQQIASIEKGTARTMISVSTLPRTIRLLPRGSWQDDSGPVMQPAVPEFLGRLETGDRRPGRLDLANWLVDTHDGVGLLTARVMANRLWYLLFGEGLARNLDDFGGQGEPPDHPELLDRLALALVANHWQLKPTIKLIVQSRAYRLSSRATSEQLAVDPENRLVAHQNAFRLPAEMIRDQMLAVSGLLVTTRADRSARPYQPAGYYRHLNFPKRKYVPDRDQNQWRRGVYVHWQRQYLHPMLKAFDAPSREECTARRPRSNTPLAALVLLNDPTAVEAARVFAARALRKDSPTDTERIQWMAGELLSRRLTSAEVEVMRRVLQEARVEFGKDPAAAEKLVAVGLAEVKSPLAAPEWAAWTEVARTMFNLGAAIVRY